MIHATKPPKNAFASAVMCHNSNAESQQEILQYFTMTSVGVLK